MKLNMALLIESCGSWSMHGFGDDLRRNAAKCRQEITFNNSLNRRSMNVQFFSDLFLVLLLVPD